LIVKYKIKIDTIPFTAEKRATIKMTLTAEPDDCVWLYRVITYALGNADKVEQLMNMDMESEDGETNPIGFVQ